MYRSKRDILSSRTSTKGRNFVPGLVPMRQKVVPRANREALAGFIRPPLQLGLVKPGTDFRHEVLAPLVPLIGALHVLLVATTGEPIAASRTPLRLKEINPVFVHEQLGNTPSSWGPTRKIHGNLYFFVQIVQIMCSLPRIFSTSGQCASPCLRGVVFLALSFQS